jgi:hypothetical protein
MALRTCFLSSKLRFVLSPPGRLPQPPGARPFVIANEVKQSHAWLCEHVFFPRSCGLFYHHLGDCHAPSGGSPASGCAVCTIEIFSDDLYQGNIYEGNTIADNQGGWQYNDVLTGSNVTATATDSDGNTSRFSWEDFDLRKPLIYLPLLSRGG